MAEDYKDIALLADNDIVVEIEVQDSPTVIIEQTGTTTAEISGDSAIGIVVGTLPTLAKEKTLADGIASIEDKFDNIKVDLTPVAKEATLLAKVAELKDALNTIDFTAIEQSIQDVEDVTAREATLIQGVADIIKAVENIDFTDLENSIAEVKNAVANIDFTTLAKEDTLTQGISTLSQKIDSIPATDLTPVAKEQTLVDKAEEIKQAVENAKPEIDTSELAKQGENQEATNTAIYNAVKSLPDLSLLYSARAEKNDDGENTYSIVLPVTAKVTYDDNGVATIQL